MTPATLADGRYVLEERLGIGGMAVVMLARDTALDRRVAVKLLADTPGRDAGLRERFLREARFAAQLSHPNVVAVYDTGEEEGQPYIVMECVDGASLDVELDRRGPLPPDEVVELGRQACAGLAHAHARGLVHRDVKPQNLLFKEDGTLKVADFGIARAGEASATLTEAGTVLGTAAYMAPEIVHGEAATPASDLYSLGAVLYELLTGRPPHPGLDRPAGAATPSVDAPGVPAALADAIGRCLDPDPAGRPASAAKLARELGETGTEQPTRAFRKVKRTRASRRRLWPALAAAVAALAIVLALALPDDEVADVPPVEPVPEGATPAQDARNRADWLRENAG